MKRFFLIAVACIAAALSAPAAFALSCMMISPDDATNLYLARLEQIKFTQQKPEHLDGTAQVTVFKIYRGDVDTLSSVRQIQISQDCDDVWGPSCPIIHQAFRNGQYWILVEREDYEFSLRSIWQGMCPGFQIPVPTQVILEEFESLHPAIWVSPAFTGIQNHMEKAGSKK